MKILAVLFCCVSCAWGSNSRDLIFGSLERSTELQREGKFAEAETVLRAALKQAEHSKDSENVGLTLSYLGNLLYRLPGRADEARASLSRAIRVWISAGNEPNPRLIRTARDLIAIFRESGDASSANRFWTKVLQPMLSRVNNDTLEFAGLLEQQGMIYVIGKQYGKAEALLTQAIEIRDRLSMPDSEELALTLANRASMRVLVHRPDEALVDLTRSLMILQRTSSVPDLSTAKVLANMGVAYFESHRIAEADFQFNRSLLILAQLPTSTGEAGILKSYAVVLRKSGRKIEARQLDSRANSILQRLASEKQGHSIDASELSLSPTK
jgi:tetratricopeptide (TPR) repeat protein